MASSRHAPSARRTRRPGTRAASLFVLATLVAVGSVSAQEQPAPGSCPWPSTPGVPWADTTAAASKLTSELGQQPDAAQLLTAGDSAFERGRHTMAYTAYSMAARDSASYEALFKAGRAAVDVGQGVKDEDRAHAWYQLGASYGRRAVKANPDAPQGHFVIAEAVGLVALDAGVRERVKMAEEIRAQALATVKADSTYAGGWHILGRWSEGVMDLSGPARFFAKAFLGAQVFGEASWKKARDDLARAVRLEPDRIVNRLELGKVYEKTDRPDDARKELQQTLRLPPRDEKDCDYLEEARQLLAKLTG
jgi:tetratricopeptide (TPR) repeat protein